MEQPFARGFRKLDFLVWEGRKGLTPTPIDLITCLLQFRFCSIYKMV